MEISLGGDQRAVPGDLPRHMDGNSRVGHPGQAGVPQVVTAQMLVAELGDDLVPVGRVPQYRPGDPAAARAGEDACCGVMADRIEAFLDKRADFFDEGDGAGAFALGAFVDEATW
jgi:hypothetical protein